jgi:ribosome-associated translation inhibitor RaiA
MVYRWNAPYDRSKKGAVMRINLSGLSFQLTHAIERHVHARVSLALQSASDHIHGVAVRLRDINGSRGGVDQSCRIVVWLDTHSPVVVEAVEADLYAAVDAAAARAKEAVWRQLKRRQTLRREYANRDLQHAGA